MSPNFNLLWAFPANLFFAFAWKFKKWRSKTRIYFWLAGALLLLSFVIGQQFNFAVYFIIMTMLVRVAMNLMEERK
jgi:hypothetical protein